MSTPTFSRLRASGAAVAVAALSIVALPAQTASAATTIADPTTAGARYLQEQLVAGGDFFSTQWGADHGVTADAVLALDAAGTGQTEAAKATAFLAAHVVDYTGFGDPSEVYAGATAKLLNVAIAQGQDPTSFGGHDLVTALTGLLQPSGRFSDKSQWGDYSNVFGQSLAIMGLSRTGGVDPKAVDFLLLQQCPGGGFSLGQSDTQCSDGSLSDPDATALAVQAIIATRGVTAEANSALDYLAGKQAASGGVGGGGPQTAVNANSTGLAGQAFLAGGRRTQAALAAGFVKGLQYDCSFPEVMRGGIAYDQAAFDAAKALGGTATPQDQDRRSTSQALLALAGTPLYRVTNQGAAAVAPALTCETAPAPVDPAPVAPAPAAPAPAPAAPAPAAPVASAPAAAAPTVTPRPARLANTGLEALPAVSLGGGLLLLGAALLLVRQRAVRR
ncbi:MAG: hypothetical protein U0Q08_02305 [Dermatophilaceae bacterium]